MNVYWLKFTDGSTGYCEGQSVHHVIRIAEHLTGKKVAVEDEHKYNLAKTEAVKSNPYPVRNMIWQFDDPVYGKCPPFCYRGTQCIGRGACPGNPSCTE
jgi:hypothetical protein